MFKKTLIGSLAIVVVVAAATSIFNTVSANSQLGQQEVAPRQVNNTVQDGQMNATGQGNQSRGNRQSSQSRGTGGDQTRTPNPQNEMSEWATFTGVVSDYVAPNFSLLTPDGQSIPAELGNTNYVASLGLTLKDGDAVTVTSFWDTNGGLALKSLTIDSTGQSFIFRDEQGRPMWAGGRQRVTP
jgi:hypothetical protein